MFTYIFQFTFFQQSPEMTIRRSPCHAAYFLKIITKHYIMIDKIFLQPHIYLYLRQGFRMACILAPADFSTYQLPPQTGIRTKTDCFQLHFQPFVLSAASHFLCTPQDWSKIAKWERKLPRVCGSALMRVRVCSNCLSSRSSMSSVMTGL